MAVPPYLFVLKGYPRLSETFIAQEILALEQRGLPIEIISLRRPTDKARHKLHEQIAAKIHYLPEYLYLEPERVLRGLYRAARLPGFRKALPAFLRDLSRDLTLNRIRRFGQAAVLATEAPEKISGLHAHFMHTPCSVARYAAILREESYSFSAHAKDIWTIPDWEKREKLDESMWSVTCTAVGANYLKSLAADPEKVRLVYHGLDHNRFPPPPENRPPREGISETDLITILSVGRLVEKKGYDILLHALADLPAALHWRFRHIGGGTLSRDMKALAARLGLEDRIDWLGACPQDKVIEELRGADFFVLASRIADDGDRDGLPNVLMEAATQKLPIISSHVSAIPEFIEDGRDGLLVHEESVDALHGAILAMIRNPEQREKYAENAYARVMSDFSMDAGLNVLESLLRDPPASSSE